MAKIILTCHRYSDWTIPLSDDDLLEIGEFTAENVKNWLDRVEAGQAGSDNLQCALNEYGYTLFHAFYRGVEVKYR